MSMITFKGIKSSYQRVKRMLSNPEIPSTESTEEPVKKKPEIVHLGLQIREVRETEREETGLEPFYDEINMSDHEERAGDGEEFYSKLNIEGKEEEGEEEGETAYSYAVLDRQFSGGYQRKAPPIKPRPQMQDEPHYDLIDKNNLEIVSEAVNEEESYSVLLRIPRSQNEETEEDSYSQGHYDDITEFQGRMFLTETEEPIKRPLSNLISPRSKTHTEAPSSTSQMMSSSEKRRSVHSELLAKMQDKIPITLQKKAPLSRQYSSNLEIKVDRRRPSQQDDLTAAIKKRLSTHFQSQDDTQVKDVPIYAVVNKLPQKKQALEKTYSTNLQLHSLSLDLTQRPAPKPLLDKSEKGPTAGKCKGLQDWEEDETDDLYERPDELKIKRGYLKRNDEIEEDLDEEMYAIPRKTR